MQLDDLKEPIREAHRRISGYIRKTPVLDVPNEFGLGSLNLKLEYLQLAGSFKSRGAFNTLLSKDIPGAGVAAASGGNHGAAVALAASTLGVKARIFVPEISSPAKVEAIRSHGAELEIGGPRYFHAQKACDAYVERTGALRIHPFDAPSTIIGQGTTALEWDRQTDGLDTVLIAAGGGGLIAGIAAWWNGTKKVIAVEPEGSRALDAALRSDGPVDVEVDSIAADSLGARNVGELVYNICRQSVADSLLVTDQQIRAAQEHLWRHYRIAVEPGGAVAFAAVMSGTYRPQDGERVGVLVCGANVDLAALAAPVAAAQ